MVAPQVYVRVCPYNHEAHSNENRAPASSTSITKKVNSHNRRKKKRKKMCEYIPYGVTSVIINIIIDNHSFACSSFL